jgi:hypothetical protein
MSALCTVSDISSAYCVVYSRSFFLFVLFLTSTRVRSVSLTRSPFYIPHTARCGEKSGDLGNSTSSRDTRPLVDPLRLLAFARLAVSRLNTHDSTAMYIPQDVVDLIIDQLALTMVEVYARERRRCLKATSLVSTVWVNPSQRHLFSTIEFDNDASVRGWCSRIKPDPYGISRHVRFLRLCKQPLSSGILETAVPHLTSFQTLEELNVDWESRTEKIDIDCPPLNVLTHIFSSLSGTLKRLGWMQTPITQDTWRVLCVLTNCLPNLMDLDLLSFHHGPLVPPALPRIRLYGDELPDPSAFDHFKFQILEIVDSISPSPPFFKHCQTHLQVLDFWGFDYRSRQYQREAKTHSDQFRRRLRKLPDVFRGVPRPPGDQLQLRLIHRTDPGLDSQQLRFPHTPARSGGHHRYNLQ